MAMANKGNCKKHQKLQWNEGTYHTFSVLLFNQLSLYIQCLCECFDFRYITQQFLH